MGNYALHVRPTSLSDDEVFSLFLSGKCPFFANEKTKSEQMISKGSARLFFDSRFFSFSLARESVNSRRALVLVFPCFSIAHTRLEHLKEVRANGLPPKKFSLRLV